MNLFRTRIRWCWGRPEGARRNAYAISLGKSRQSQNDVLTGLLCKLSFGLTNEESVLAPITILLILAAGWADATANACDPILTLEGEEWVVSSCSRAIEGEIERPSVEFLLQPTRVELGPLPPYSPLHALPPDPT